MLKYTEVELRREINAVIENLMTRGEPVYPQWVTQAVCKKHAAGLPKDKKDKNVHIAFWRFGGYTVTRKCATTCVNELDDAPRQEAEPIDQPFPGFERVHVQKYYVTTREGVDVAVPTMEMTDEELHAKVNLYRRNSAKLAEHADEIERFIDWRHAQRDVVGL